MRDPIFIAADILTKLVEGSYESLITRVQKLVEDHRAEIFGTDAELQIRVSGTYTRHAIVLSTSATKPLVRIEFAEGTKGSLKLVKHEVVLVPTYDVESRDDYAHLEAHRAVEAMLAGDVEGAIARLQESMRHTAPASTRTAADIMGSLTEHLKAPRRWRTATAGSHAAGIKKFLGERHDMLVSGLPTLRYRTRQGVALGDVRKGFDALVARFEAMGRRVQSAREGLVERSVSLSETVRSALATFGMVAEDLALDVQAVRKLAKESVRVLDKPENLAQVYDALADALFEYEIATAYIASLVERLAG